MKGTVHTKEPNTCTEGELREFARLVRQGFATANESLEGRVRDAKWLAFHYGPSDTLEAVAAIKAPTTRYRHDVFRMADACASPADYTLELGWVFVAPGQRGSQIAERLCRQLLERVPASSLFATTRTDNFAMMKILNALGFTRVGTPYSWRNEELMLFLRPSPRA